MQLTIDIYWITYVVADTCSYINWFYLQLYQQLCVYSIYNTFGHLVSIICYSCSLSQVRRTRITRYSKPCCSYSTLNFDKRVQLCQLSNYPELRVCRVRLQCNFWVLTDINKCCVLQVASQLCMQKQQLHYFMLIYPSDSHALDPLPVSLTIATLLHTKCDLISPMHVYSYVATQLYVKLG